MSIDQKSFDKEYFYNVCLGSEEFKKSNGLKLHPKVKSMIDSLNIKPSMDILDIGCGRGDAALYAARKAKSVTGIDYSTQGIRIANKIKRSYPKKIQAKTKFFIMKATNLDFQANSFDLILLIDVLDHLNSNEQERMLKDISRILKNDGIVYVHTCANKVLLSHTYKYHIYPMNKILTGLDKIIKNTNYESLPRNPRTKEQAHQHINETDYFTLKEIFGKYNFRGKISSEVGFIKEGSSIRTKIYNFLITFYPLSKKFPLCYFYAGSFVCKFKLVKKPFGRDRNH